MDNNEARPIFPKRAVITAGMPYGNKKLHFGHISAVFIPADFYARFLRDRIGKENVLFVSGTDCYGSPIEESYRALCEKGEFNGSLEDFVRANHISQKKTLEDYSISLDLFGASALDDAKNVHARISKEFINGLKKRGRLEKNSTMQFYDAKAGKFLNGRQVVGKCPVQNCNSDKGYADECALGHQYRPETLIDPKSTLTGETPEMRPVSNWYFKLVDYRRLLTDYIEGIRRNPTTRKLVYNTVKEFLEPPMIYVKNEFEEDYRKTIKLIPPHELRAEPKKTSFALVFEKLADCDSACAVLTENGVRFRTGKTLVPFRLTGNVKWGVPAPVFEDGEDLTVWVWPESLWAPISFTSVCLDTKGAQEDAWKKWWCSPDCGIYQFIGSDNIYFYGVAQQAMFMAQQDGEPVYTPAEGELQTTTLVANNHILFLDKKASSSAAVKPPMAQELLDYYTAEQLRAHFLSLNLAARSVSFQPKPFNPSSNPEDTDPVVKEGNLLTNVFNRMVRSCFYTAQKYFDGKLPEGALDDKVAADSRDAVLKYERHMYKFEFHQVMYVLDSYIRGANKYWSKNSTDADRNNDAELRAKALANLFYMVKVAAVLIHPLAPDGTEMIREYLGLSEELWSWDTILDPVGKTELKYLPPKTDFFTRHPSQLNFENDKD